MQLLQNYLNNSVPETLRNTCYYTYANTIKIK